MSYFVHNILQIPNSFVTNKMLPALKIILTSIDPRTITVLRKSGLGRVSDLFDIKN